MAPFVVGTGSSLVVNTELPEPPTLRSFMTEAVTSRFPSLTTLGLTIVEAVEVEKNSKSKLEYMFVWPDELSGLRSMECTSHPVPADVVRSQSNGDVSDPLGSSTVSDVPAACEIWE